MTLLSVLSSPSAPTRCFAVGVEGEYWPRDRELLQGQPLGHLPEEEDMGTREVGLSGGCCDSAPSSTAKRKPLEASGSQESARAATPRPAQPPSTFGGLSAGSPRLQQLVNPADPLEIQADVHWTHIRENQEERVSPASESPPSRALQEPRESLLTGDAALTPCALSPLPVPMPRLSLVGAGRASGCNVVRLSSVWTPGGPPLSSPGTLTPV
ncbi:hypothetical protein J1605_004326 [Eschrichtius robustus]|uniref:Uncharacterized protein n=1 Tax=Eschrichtius robustus TaxID=9764 RepID=A0AB34HID6_ESCRO|nr:hypothetical protein J1605_004326 [Eschrichtius robustus]